MKKFSPPEMKEVSLPTPHTLHPLSSQESARIARITFLKIDDRIYVRLLTSIWKVSDLKYQDIWPLTYRIKFPLIFHIEISKSIITCGY